MFNMYRFRIKSDCSLFFRGKNGVGFVSIGKYVLSQLLSSFSLLLSSNTTVKPYLPSSSPAISAHNYFSID